MPKQKFMIVIEEDEDGVYIGTVPELKGCYSYGETPDEVMKNIKEAIQTHLELLKKGRKELPTAKFTGVQELEIEV
jgi:predicted RNase H-like HicB family nuclease